MTWELQFPLSVGKMIEIQRAESRGDIVSEKGTNLTSQGTNCSTHLYLRPEMPPPTCVPTVHAAPRKMDKREDKALP